MVRTPSPGKTQVAIGVLRNIILVRTAHCKNTLMTFCGFSRGSNQYWAGRVYDMCVYFMTGTPEGSTESGFYGER